MRKLLAALGAIAVIAVGAVIFVAADDNGAASASRFRAVQRTHLPGSYRLEIAGADAGPVNVVVLGRRFADVVVGDPRSTGVDKGLGTVRAAEFVLDVGTAPQPLASWMLDSLRHLNSSPRRNGAIVALDADQKVQTRTEFTGALITEMGFPALDGADKDPTFIRLKLVPETTKTLPGGGAAPKTGATSQGLSAGGFRMTISGVDTSKVLTVDALTVKRPPGGSLDMGNLRIEFSGSAASWLSWFDQSVPTSTGSQGRSNERTLRIDYLDPDLKTVRGSLAFSSCGIFKLNTVDERSAADVYCEGLVPTFPVATPAAVTTTSAGAGTSTSANTIPANGTACEDDDPNTINGQFVNGVCLSEPGPTTTAGPTSTSIAGQTFFRDADADGFGDPATTQVAAQKPAGFTAQGGDCNDANSSIKPGASEVTGNNVDENCNGSLSN